MYYVFRYLHFVISLYFAELAANTKRIINEANYLYGESEKNNPFNLCSYFSSPCKFFNEIFHNC